MTHLSDIARLLHSYGYPTHLSDDARLLDTHGRALLACKHGRGLQTEAPARWVQAV